MRHGFNAAALHGDLDQSARTAALDSFRNGEVKLLIASDVAARGLDIPDVSHVFNFDVPHHADDYVHRIGRTGRAGKTGTAITIVAPGRQQVGRRDREADRPDAFPGRRRRRPAKRPSRERDHASRDRAASHGEIASAAAAHGKRRRARGQPQRRGTPPRPATPRPRRVAPASTRPAAQPRKPRRPPHRAERRSRSRRSAICRPSCCGRSASRPDHLPACLLPPITAAMLSADSRQLFTRHSPLWNTVAVGGTTPPERFRTWGRPRRSTRAGGAMQ